MAYQKQRLHLISVHSVMADQKQRLCLISVISIFVTFFDFERGNERTCMHITIEMKRESAYT
jgi:hypothetical protein